MKRRRGEASGSAAGPDGVRELSPKSAQVRTAIIASLTSVAGIVPTLMKPRNGQRWTEEERRKLHRRLRGFAHLSPLLILLLLPGSVLLLPAYAWWLDRRRRRRVTRPEA
ncbi:MAG: hypothetical protein AUK49_05820 [Betaproteobacteria bacterium CG2_30_68_42]|nr:MAG: hypothetical protein AUK49_05820 [Betaproteobacteria bacterium CG2_30_68_42]